MNQKILFTNAALLKSITCLWYIITKLDAYILKNMQIKGWIKNIYYILNEMTILNKLTLGFIEKKH
jgi:hypothetical protein